MKPKVSLRSECWVYTKWGAHKAKIIMPIKLDGESFVIVEMLGKGFCSKTKIQTIKAEDIEYIPNKNK